MPDETTTDHDMTQQIKPIVSDIMTVSSKETLDSRDEKDTAHDNETKQHPSGGTLAPHGRYPPPSNPNQQQQQQSRAPFSMQNRGNYGPPPPLPAAYYGYGQPPLPPHHPHHPSQQKFNNSNNNMMLSHQHNGYGGQPPPPHFMGRPNMSGPPPMQHHALNHHPGQQQHGLPPPQHHQVQMHLLQQQQAQAHHIGANNHSMNQFFQHHQHHHHHASMGGPPLYAAPANGSSMPMAAFSNRNNGRADSPPQHLQAASSMTSTNSSLLGRKRSMETSFSNAHVVTGLYVNGNMFRRSDGKLESHSHELMLNDNGKIKTHRRNHSGASTASSLSVGGYSFESYEGPRVGAIEDQLMTDMQSNSPKRRKGDQLLVDTSRPDSSCSMGTEKGFEQMSIEHAEEDARSKQQPHSTSSASSAGHGNLFLSLSTSPINQDIDQTPVKKNTNRNDSDMEEEKETPEQEKNVPSSIFKFKGSMIDKPKIDTALSDVSRPSDTPTPPASQNELTRTASMAEEHSLLNRHLRNQSFTPLPHLNTTGSSGASPSNAAFASAMAAPQLSWSIAGDTPSLGDLADWDDDHPNHGKLIKTDQKIRPGSATSASSARHMAMSPQDFQFWKEEQDMADVAMSGTTTPLPAFFEQGTKDGAENGGIRFDAKSAQGQKSREYDYNAHPMIMGRNGGGLRMVNNKQQQHLSGPSSQSNHNMLWGKHIEDAGNKTPIGMPPTPMFGNSEFRDDVHFGPRSPMGGDRREGGMEFGGFPVYPPHHLAQSHNDRIRNLRGRMHPAMHMPPMPLHIPPPMSSHLPMTSPMGLGPKAGLWSPHHHPHHPFHGGMHPGMGSPHHHHHMGSPLNSMAHSKRKCVPLKPPIPSKFQGEMESAKSAPVPEFTSLVNFPAHMSQKQSVNLPEGMRCCVMCGQACQCTLGNKTKKCPPKKGSDSSLAPRSSNGQDCMGDKGGGFAMIPSQNKGLCTLCDVNVWVIVSAGLEIKWCKGCKNFRPWAAFGEKGLATKCLRCRDRQREKYALQKEEKEKSRAVIKVKK
ncbi:hypothetical protein MPSEU_000262600 [Mayamaea pseudoterrestris]|nr:hypothetical protein MPSEU_000262600 [Mayamaea pseudoterrestris]